MCCAAALRRSNVTNLVIVDRSSEVSAHGGTGIAIPPNGARALAAVGLPVDRLVARGRRLRAYRFLDTAGRELGCGDLTRLWLGETYQYFAVHRRRIYELLIKALGDQTIEFSSTVELAPGPLTSDQPVVARITGPDGTREETFDPVIGADGIRSVVRQAIAPSVNTARAYQTEAEIFLGMGHDMMLDTDWRKVADWIGAWIREAKQQKRQISCTLRTERS